MTSALPFKGTAAGIVLVDPVVDTDSYTADGDMMVDDNGERVRLDGTFHSGI